jgi:hypothetical protein
VQDFELSGMAACPLPDEETAGRRIQNRRKMKQRAWNVVERHAK